MANKHRGDIDFRFTDGAFKSPLHTTPLQMYRVFECEPNSRADIGLEVTEQHKMFLYCLSGEGKIYTPDSVLDTSNNHLVFLPHGKYKLHSTSKTPCRFACVIFGSTLKDVSRSHELFECASFFDSLQVPLCIKVSCEYSQIFSSFLDELSFANPAPLLLKGHFYQIMLIAFRYFSAHSETGNEDYLDSHAVGHTAYAIIRYIDEHLFTMNNLLEMAEELGYSYNYLSHLFRRKTGMTIQMYVNRKKIETSTSYLKDEQYSITEIAAMLNYDCIQSFSKAFRRSMGVSPTEYRSMHTTASYLNE